MVEQYLAARVGGDLARMTALSCAKWEAGARIEAASFKAMTAALEGVACTTSGSDASSASVACTGKIVTSYNGETRDWRMDERAFNVSLDNGEWRVCGYK